jgi:hypothetical protein
MNTCRVNFDTNAYYDKLAKCAEAQEPTEDHVKRKLVDMVDEIIIDTTHPLIGEAIANCSEAWEDLTTIEPVESVDDLKISQILYLARMANKFLKELGESLGDDLYEKAVQKARDEL